MIRQPDDPGIDDPCDPMPPRLSRIGSRTGLHAGSDRRPHRDGPGLMWGLAALGIGALALAMMIGGTS